MAHTHTTKQIKNQKPHIDAHIFFYKFTNFKEFNSQVTLKKNCFVIALLHITCNVALKAYGITCFFFLLLQNIAALELGST